MDLRIFTEPQQGASYDQLLAAARAAARLQEWGEAGAERVYLQVLDVDDLDHIALVGRDVRGEV